MKNKELEQALADELEVRKGLLEHAEIEYREFRAKIDAQIEAAKVKTREARADVEQARKALNALRGIKMNPGKPKQNGQPKDVPAEAKVAIALEAIRKIADQGDGTFTVSDVQHNAPVSHAMAERCVKELRRQEVVLRRQ